MPQGTNDQLRANDSSLSEDASVMKVVEYDVLTNAPAVLPAPSGSIFQNPSGIFPPRKNGQRGEEGRRVFSESFEENPLEEDPILNRQFCIHSIPSPNDTRLAAAGGGILW